MEDMVLPGKGELRKQSIMASPDEFIQETPAGLRLTALENMYKKLDTRGQGYLEDIVIKAVHSILFFALFCRLYFPEKSQ